jgi:hypothetical protein
VGAFACAREGSVRERLSLYEVQECYRRAIECGIRCIADRIPTQAGQHSDDCGQPMKPG